MDKFVKDLLKDFRHSGYCSPGYFSQTDLKILQQLTYQGSYPIRESKFPDYSLTFP